MYQLGALHFTNPTGSKHTATVIFFHGSGSSGSEMMKWVNIMYKNFSFPHIRVLYPTAPLQPYSPAGGQPSYVWFDRNGISPSVAEELVSLSRIEMEVKKLLKMENEAGIPSERIIVGGFSMGGSLSFHTAFRWDKNLAGAFVLSSFLNDGSLVYKELRATAPGKKLPRLLQIHGNIDDLVDVSWGDTTFKNLKNYGVKGEFHVMDNLGHALNRNTIVIIKDWIERVLPEAPDP